MSIGLDISACRLRQLGLEDAERTLLWRNDPCVRAAMITDHKIDPAEHAAWIRRVLEDPSRAHFILEIYGAPAGTVGFSGLDSAHGLGDWTFHLRPHGAPRGAGSALGLLALDRFFGELGRRKLSAEVIEGNTRSLRLHERLGFRVEGRRRAHLQRGQGWRDLHLLALFREDWAHAREAVREALSE